MRTIGFPQTLTVVLAAFALWCGVHVSTALAAGDTTERFRIVTEDIRKVSSRYRRQIVAYPTKEFAGTIIIDAEHKFLYLVMGGGRALRYGIGVGRDGFTWSGTAVVRRKAKWPRWLPPKEMVERDELAAKWQDGMPGGPENPLGARALYLFQGDVDTLYRIHGTFQPQSIGRAVSSGCIRLLNADIVDLYARVPLGTKVIVLPSSSFAAQEQAELPTWRDRRSR